MPLDSRTATNRVALAGRLAGKGALRHTPVGVPVIEFRIAHASEQVEAGQPRQVECELRCVAIGPVALLLKDIQPGTGIGVSGFLAARSLKQQTLVLHTTTIEFAEID